MGALPWFNRGPRRGEGPSQSGQLAKASRGRAGPLSGRGPVPPRSLGVWVGWWWGDLCNEGVECQPCLYAVSHRKATYGVERGSGLPEGAFADRFREKGPLCGGPETRPKLAGGGEVPTWEK